MLGQKMFLLIDTLVSYKTFKIIPCFWLPTYSYFFKSIGKPAIFYQDGYIHFFLNLQCFAVFTSYPAIAIEIALAHLNLKLLSVFTFYLAIALRTYWTPLLLCHALLLIPDLPNSSRKLEAFASCHLKKKALCQRHN